jgi:hypothetical protein
MKLEPEIIRFAFLMNKVFENTSGDGTLVELYVSLRQTVEELALDIDGLQLREGVNPRLFAESCALAADKALAIVDYLNQLPVCRHGLIEAINDHLPA